MDDTDPSEMFRTLRGFINGQEPGEANYFHFSATLRIHGDGIPFEEISERLGVERTHVHRKGEHHGHVHPPGMMMRGISSQGCPEQNHWNATSSRFGKLYGPMLITSKR